MNLPREEIYGTKLLLFLFLSFVKIDIVVDFVALVAKRLRYLTTE